MEMLLSGEYQPFYADSNIAPQALIKQAWHLAGALHFLHHRLVDRRKRITCCHMDLKPANILILRHRDMPIGKWMLIDFGISVIRTEPRSAGSAADLFTDEYRMLPASVTKSSRYLSDYQPPEVEQSLPVSLIGDETRKGDIWSFGCILLVLLMFSLGGAPLVNKLHATKRSEGQTDFFYLALDAGARPVAKAKSKVKRWAYQMGNHQGSWAYEFLQLVFEHMLQVPVDMRQDANQIQDQLDVVWRQAPTENIWNSLPQNPRVRTMSPPWNESIATSVSLLSSRRPSGAAIMASTFELDPHTPSRDRSVDPLLLGRESPKGDFPPLSPKTSDSTETHSTGSTTQLLPAAEMSLRDDLPSADDMAVFSDSAYIVFWHGQSVIPYSRNYSTWRPDGPMFSREVSGTVSAGLEAKHPDKWIDISLSGSYIAMIKSSPSSILVSVLATVFFLKTMLLIQMCHQVKAIDLNLGQFVLPSTEWPPFQCLRSVCVSSHGSLALIYDKKITFRFVG